MSKKSDEKGEQDVSISVASAEVLTEHDKGIMEAGRRIYVESVDSGREYCKHMIAVSAGAIPIYVGLLKLGISDKHSPSATEYLIWMIPAILFLSSLLAFSFGFLPGSHKINLGNLNSVESVRNKLIMQRQIWSLLGFVLLAFGVIFGFVILFVRQEIG